MTSPADKVRILEESDQEKRLWLGIGTTSPAPTGWIP